MSGRVGAVGHRPSDSWDSQIKPAERRESARLDCNLQTLRTIRCIHAKGTAFIAVPISVTYTPRWPHRPPPSPLSPTIHTTPYFFRRHPRYRRGLVLEPVEGDFFDSLHFLVEIRSTADKSVRPLWEKHLQAATKRGNPSDKGLQKPSECPAGGHQRGRVA